MAIRYTVTTHTKSCPHCGMILDEKIDNSLLTGIVVLIFLPIAIPYFLIRLGLGFPDIPKIGPKVEFCPRCSWPIKTKNKSLDELDFEELLTYRFRIWFYISYVLGAIFGISALCLLNGVPIVSWCGLICLLSVFGVIAIIITYHVMYKNKIHEIKIHITPKGIITATITIVLLLVIGGVIAYNYNYDAYIDNYFLKNQAINNELRFDVSIEVELIEYNHLGTDITIEHTIDNQLVENGDTISAKSSFLFTTVITEHDGIDDVGYESTKVLLSPYSYTTQNCRKTVTQNIIVREEGGTKYKRGYAEYDVTVVFTPHIDKSEINIFDVIFYKK